MEPFEDDRLIAALESLRPEPRPAFAAALDERAAAGFPRRSGSSAWRRIADRLKAIEPRRALIPAGATALAAIAAVTVVVAIGESDQRANLNSRFSGPAATGGAAPPPPAGANSHSPGRHSGADSQYEAAVPSTGMAQGESSASAAGSTLAQVQRFSRAADRNSGFNFNALSAPRRDIERSAQLVLGTEAAAVRKAASEVFDTVHAYRGIVLNSSIRDGEEGEAGARFALLIPSAKLGDAMADFSAIGEVRSRREATADITAPTVRTGELLRESRATIEGLLAQLATADTDAERTATEAKLRAERRHAAYLRAQLSNLERRANLSRVGLQIESGAPDTSAEEGSGWGIGDALDDAGHILAIAAAVTIVGLAILGPIALIALLAWLANRSRVKRARHRALA